MRESSARQHPPVDFLDALDADQASARLRERLDLALLVDAQQPRALTAYLCGSIIYFPLERRLLGVEEECLKVVSITLSLSLLSQKVKD
jgi:hypothetical protein